MKVLIISGGSSSERKISFISAKAVRDALLKNGHQVKIFDLLKGKSALEKLILSFDVIFPVLHGEEGEGGDLQKFLAKLGKPYVGGNPQGFKQGWYKILFKKFCQNHGIITSPWKIVKNIQDLEKFGFPSVLKASSGGSSKEVVILRSARDLKKKSVQDLLNSGLELFVEKFLPGIETTVGILSNQVLPVIEIVPPEGKWFDYKNKYTGKTQEIPHAPSLTEKQRKQVQKTALKIHQTLNLGSYSRIDFIISDLQCHLGGVSSIPVVLEVNTIPGLTSESLFPKAAKAAGISFEELVEKLILASKR